ncbi:hypothetical protein DKK70_05620 [Gilliamella apicola]|uniref:Uncharacterized protein n=1 Tax=Gilliamella apicola TaxID=1196095 RepID=A0A2V4E294_9GAMM|nr:hypothetical protein DKK70_05620 [Gilliamella apicola]
MIDKAIFFIIAFLKSINFGNLKLVYNLDTKRNDIKLEVKSLLIKEETSYQQLNTDKIIVII